MQIIKVVFGVLLLLHLQVLTAQTAIIKGEISSQNQPVPFANIGLFNTPIGTSSDINGQFEIVNVPAGEYQLVVSAVGFETYYQKIQVSESASKQLIINLQESTQTLDAVVVSGTMKEVSKMASPVPIEVYGQAFFKSNPAPSIFESLQNVNGVRPQVNCNVCNTGDIHINGLEGPYTMVLIDGMPIVSGLSTVYGLSGIPQALIDRVEIVKGPASTLYGSEAVGGLINIITKSAVTTPRWSTDLMVSGWGEVSLDAGTKLKTGKKSHSILGLSYFNYQNPIDHNGDGFTDLTLQNRISIFNKWSFGPLHQPRLEVAGRLVFEDRWGGQTNWTKSDRGGNEVYGESIYTRRWELFGTYHLKPNLLRLQVSTNAHHQNSAYGTTLFNADQYIGFVQLVANKQFGIHELLGGLVYRSNYYDDNTVVTLNQSNQLNKPVITHLPGAFIQNEISLSDNHHLLLGLRYDLNSIHGNILTPRINYKWNSLNQMTAVRWSIGNGYRVANVFTEDHAALTGARTVEFQENLLPETSWNTNLNWTQKLSWSNGFYLGIDASAFYTYFTNRIIPDYESHPDKIIYANLKGYSVSKGVSANLDFSTKKAISGQIGATLMDVSVIEENTAHRQLLTESFQGVWSLGYQFRKQRLKVDYTGNLLGPMRLPLLGDLDERSPYSPWHSIQNIQITKDWKSQWQFYGGVKNLLNFTPPANSIARAFDPFDKGVKFDQSGVPMATPDNPQALTFDPAYVYATNQGIRFFLGVRYKIY